LRILYSHRIHSRDGQSVHLEELVAALRDAGHEVRVVGPSNYQQEDFGGESRLILLIRERVPPAIAELAEIAYNIPAFWRLWQAARAFHPDLVYERNNLFFLAGTWLSRWLRLPLFLEVNAPLAAERAQHGRLGLRWIAGRLEAYVWRSAAKVFAVTGVLKSAIERAGVPANRIEVVPNGINLSEFGDARAPERQDGRVVLGFVGFVREWHGLDAVIGAMAAARDATPMELVVVGDGPIRPALEQQAAASGLADHVRFTGLQPRERIPALVAGFDIALQPRAVEYASPLKIFEYMAAGRAIIAPDQENIREILQHDQTALLFDPAQPDAMWQAILRLATDAELRRRLGSAARAEISRRDYTWAGNARRVVAWARQSGRVVSATP
jgi:glycosyltransferase involved in cell wall biosynthesis